MQVQLCLAQNKLDLQLRNIERCETALAAAEKKYVEKVIYKPAEKFEILKDEIEAWQSLTSDDPQVKKWLALLDHHNAAFLSLGKGDLQQPAADIKDITLQSVQALAQVKTNPTLTPEAFFTQYKGVLLALAEKAGIQQQSEQSKLQKIHAIIELKKDLLTLGRIKNLSLTKTLPPVLEAVYQQLSKLSDSIHSYQRAIYVVEAQANEIAREHARYPQIKKEMQDLSVELRQEIDEVTQEMVLIQALQPDNTISKKEQKLGLSS